MGPADGDPMKERWALSGIGMLSALVLAGVGFVLLGRQPGLREGVDLSALPALNAVLNGTSAVVLAVGYLFIRRRQVTAHRACMLTALVASSLFLVSYLIYHYQVGSKPFGGAGWIRWVYFPLLVSHIGLAAVIVPLALVTLYRASRAQFDRHRRLARWTLPLWLYVSVTGVLVYWLLYQFPSG